MILKKYIFSLLFCIVYTVAVNGQTQLNEKAIIRNLQIIDSFNKLKVNSKNFEINFSFPDCYCKVPPEICNYSTDEAIEQFKYVYEIFLNYDSSLVKWCSYFVNIKKKKGIRDFEMNHQEMTKEFKLIARSIKKWEKVFLKKGLVYCRENKIHPLYYSKTHCIMRRMELNDLNR
jgi:hypothetical protein